MQNNSHLDSETISLTSGGDTTLSGAVAKGKLFIGKSAVEILRDLNRQC
ncbi:MULTISPECIES: hemagglutinin repeat-containing protein [Rodentibacter]